MSRVILLRHALSAWNLDGRWQGQADPPLAAGGEETARAAAAVIGPFDAVVASDLERARRTAAILAPAPPARTDPGWREYHVGEWSGLTRVEIEAEWPGLLARFDSGELQSTPGGEARPDFEARVQDAVNRLVRTTATDGRVLVVTHGGVIRAIARLHGWPEVRIGHLSGYEAATDAADKGKPLTLLHPLDLLNGSGPNPGRTGELSY